MPTDSRAAFQDLLANVDGLIETVEKRSGMTKTAGKTVSSSVAAIAAAVAETDALAKSAQKKLAAVHREKLARRAEKVKTAQHIALVASRLLA
jgi:hypothetical protein